MFRRKERGAAAPAAAPAGGVEGVSTAPATPAAPAPPGDVAIELQPQVLTYGEQSKMPAAKAKGGCLGARPPPCFHRSHTYALIACSGFQDTRAGTTASGRRQGRSRQVAA